MTEAIAAGNTNERGNILCIPVTLDIKRVNGGRGAARLDAATSLE